MFTNPVVCVCVCVCVLCVKVNLYVSMWSKPIAGCAEEDGTCECTECASTDLIISTICQLKYLLIEHLKLPQPVYKVS